MVNWDSNKVSNLIGFKICVSSCMSVMPGASELWQTVASCSHFSFAFSPARVVSPNQGVFIQHAGIDICFIWLERTLYQKRVMKSSDLHPYCLYVGLNEAVSIAAVSNQPLHVGADSARACLHKRMINLERSLHQQEEMQPCLQRNMKHLHVTFQGRSWVGVLIVLGGINMFFLF